MAASLEKIAEALKKAEVECEIENFDNFSAIETGFLCENCNVNLHIFIEKEGEIICFATGPVVKVHPKRRRAVLDLLNRLHNDYLCVKFMLDEDGDIIAEYDIPANFDDESLNSVCLEVVGRFVCIIDDAYPKIMKAVWG